METKETIHASVTALISTAAYAEKRDWSREEVRRLWHESHPGATAEDVAVLDLYFDEADRLAKSRVWGAVMPPPKNKP